MAAEPSLAGGQNRGCQRHSPFDSVRLRFCDGALRRGGRLVEGCPRRRRRLCALAEGPSRRAQHQSWTRPPPRHRPADHLLALATFQLQPPLDPRSDVHGSLVVTYPHAVSFFAEPRRRHDPDRRALLESRGLLPPHPRASRLAARDDAGALRHAGPRRRMADRLGGGLAGGDATAALALRGAADRGPRLLSGHGGGPRPSVASGLGGGANRDRKHVSCEPATAPIQGRRTSSR